ncbi:hypothetical protein LINPERPRIM_LOCUS26733 [Linum perenne]
MNASYQPWFEARLLMKLGLEEANFVTASCASTGIFNTGCIHSLATFQGTEIAAESLPMYSILTQLVQTSNCYNRELN